MEQRKKQFRDSESDVNDLSSIVRNRLHAASAAVHDRSSLASVASSLCSFLESAALTDLRELDNAP